MKHVCSICNKQFSKRSDLIRHTKSQHEGIRYNCTNCDKRFTDKAYLRKHIKIKHESFTGNNVKESIQSKQDKLEDVPPKNIIKCPECSESFYLESKMEAHFLQVHDDMNN